MQKENYDFLLKYIIIGNQSTGKTCLLHNFLQGQFKKNSSYTIGVEFGSKLISLGDRNIKLQIWDTAGQERFKSVARTYYRGAVGAIIVYDITNIETFNALVQWIKDVRELSRSDISIVVCGNQSDLLENRTVAYLEATKFCQENNVTFYETSALNGDNIGQAFNSLTLNVLELIKSGAIDQEELKPQLGGSSNSGGSNNSAPTQIRNMDVNKDKDDEKKQSGCMGCA